MPEVVDSESGRSMPSYVTSTEPKDTSRRYAWALQRLEGLGKCVAVGELAKRRMSRQPSDVVFNIKKLIDLNLFILEDSNLFLAICMAVKSFS